MPKSQPERTCIVTGEAGGKEGLLRFVVGPDDTIVPDVAGKLPGRGMWVSCNRAIVEQAITKNAFRRAARKQVKVGAALLEQIEQLLADRALQALALARKSGQAIAGYEKVKVAIEQGDVLLLLQADDVSEDSARKLLIDKAIPVHYMNRDRLAAIMGRDNLAHIAVLNGPGGANAKEQWERFAGFTSKT
jgi:predicted RNA-binding protein YlxR (DUF448 family)